MGFKEAIRVTRKPDALPSPPTMPHDTKYVQTDKRGRSMVKDDAYVSAATDPDLVGKQPKRSASFGRSFGGLSSLTNGMSHTLSRKSSNGTSTPPIAPSTVIGHPVGGVSGASGAPESSHLAQFSLKLSELVNKAFVSCSGSSAGSASGAATLAGAAKSAAAKTATAAYATVPSLATITYEGRKLPSKHVISEIAMIVVAELEYAASVDPYLLRAVSRQALKALTPFADRIDSLVVQPSKDPAATQIPATAKEGTHIPAALEYNIGLVSLEYIVEDALERCIEGPPGSIDEGMPAFVSEILTPVRKRMEGTILHVIQPILSSAKVSMTSTLAKAVLAPFAGYGQNLSPATSNATAASASMAGLGALSPPIAPAASLWLRELEGKVDGTRKLLIPRLVERCGQDGEGWFISVVIYVIWKGLLTLTSRSMPVFSTLATKYPAAAGATPLQLFAAEANKRAPSPAQLTTALKSVSVVGRARKPQDGSSLASGVATPSSVNSTSATIPSAGAQIGAKATANQLSDLQGFEKVMRKFAAGFTVQEKRYFSLRRESEGESSDSDSDDDDEDELARAALTEALQAIRSTVLVAQWLDAQPEAVLEAASRMRGRAVHPPTTTNVSVLPADVVHAAKAIPPLLLLHLVYARMPTNVGVFALQSRPEGDPSPTVPPPPAAFGYSWTVYERAIGGFAGGQTWASALTQAWRQDIDEAWAEIKARETSVKMPQDEPLLRDGSTSNRNSSSSEHSSPPPLDVTSAKASPKPVAAPLTPGALLHPDALDSSSSLDPSESTPTPASVLHRVNDRISPATSAGNSSESLPEHMTQSAPTLRQEREEKSGTSSTADLHHATPNADTQSQQISGTATSTATSKERPTWNFIRKASRKQSGSETSSPPHSLSPRESPPQTPNVLAIGHGGQDARPAATSSRRFWRTHSSQSVTGTSSAGQQQQQQQQTQPNDGRSLHLHALSGLRSTQSGGNGHSVLPRESDRIRDDAQVEAECLRLLTRALDAVEAKSGSAVPTSST